LPIYITMGPKEDVVLRIPIESVATETEPKEELLRFRRRDSDENERFYSGTRVLIETSDRTASSFTSDASLLAALLPMMRDCSNSKLQWRFFRRL